MRLNELLGELAAGEESLPWDAWFALVAAAEQDRAAWNEAWLTLPPGDRTLLLARLVNDAGPLADALVQLCASQVDQEPDPFTRETLHQDAAEAAERSVERIRRLRDEVATQVTRLNAPLDLAEEVQRLRADRDHRKAALEADPEHQARVELEQELVRLRTFERSLAAYDRAGRDAERRLLQAQTDELAETRRALEQQVRDAIDEQGKEEERLTKVRGEIESTEREVQEHARRVTEQEETLRRARAALRDWQARLDGQQRELAELNDGISQITANVEHIRSEVERSAGQRQRVQQWMNQARPQFEARMGELESLWARHKELRRQLISGLETVEAEYSAGLERAEEDLRRWSLPAVPAAWPAQAGYPVPPAPPSPARPSAAPPPDPARRRSPLPFRRGE